MIDLSSSTDPRIGVAGRVLADVGAVTAKHGVRVMVIGATARDILAEAIVGTPPARATADVDVAVAVPSWAAFRGLTADLARVGRSPHRFLVDGVQVDVVPFGDIESAARTVDWEDGTRMSVLGLREVHARAEVARLPGGADVLVPSLPGLAVLKLVAWSDRRLETRRDAVDLQTMLGWLQAAQLLEELYENHLDALIAYDFDPTLAACFTLGREMAGLLDGTAADVVALLDDDRLGQLVADMPRSVADQTEAIRALRDGLRR